MFTTLQRRTAASPVCQALEMLARQHFALHDDAQVVVDERRTTLPGCPPWETAFDFWTDQADGSTQRHHCKVFKPAHEVLPSDLPPRWMKPALVVGPDTVCACC